MAGFVIFDTETTGLRQGWDQILHFAALRTDADLQVKDEFEERSRLQPHVVAHPQALLTNGLPIVRLRDPTLPSHYEMVCRIRRKLLDWSPAIFAGFNSIGFDEHMLRHALFQSLYDPYLTSTPGNGRADVMGLALTAVALNPGCLRVPRHESGRPTFKLERLAAENGLAYETAHDALSDAKVTLELCRLIRDRAEEAWQRFNRFSTKAGVTQFIEAEDGFVLTEFFGNEAYHRAVVCLGQEPRNANGRFCLDLALDPRHWRAMTDEELAAALLRKPSPIRRLATNAAPTLTALWEAPADWLNGLDLTMAEDRARRFAEDDDLRMRLIQAYTASWTDTVASTHPEDCLYSGGFPCDEDKRRRGDFHEASRSERLRIIDAFEDPRLQAFGRRLFHAEHRGSFSEAERLAADLDLADRLLEEHRGGLTLSQALAEVERLVEKNVDDPFGLLPDYRAWLLDRIARTEAFRRRQVL
jgi:exodeoxyribonuclease I